MDKVHKRLPQQLLAVITQQVAGARVDVLETPSRLTIKIASIAFSAKARKSASLSPGSGAWLKIDLPGDAEGAFASAAP